MIISNCYDISIRLLEMKAWLMRILKIKEVPCIDKTIVSINNLLSDTIMNKTKSDFFKEISSEIYSKDRQRIYDSSVLIDIFNYFSNTPSHKIPRKKLLKIMNLLDISEENINDGSIEARNILFELEIATLFAKCGIDIIDFDDVTINYYNHRINFQCKRLHSINPKTVANNILTAKDQYCKRKNECTMGIVVLGAENLLKNTSFYNDEYNYYYQKSDSILINSEDLQTLTLITKNAQEYFFKQYVSPVIDIITDISSLFVIYRFNSINFTKKGIVNYININNIDFSFNNNINGESHKAIIKKLINKIMMKYC